MLTAVQSVSKMGLPFLLPPLWSGLGDGDLLIYKSNCVLIFETYSGEFHPFPIKNRKEFRHLVLGEILHSIVLETVFSLALSSEPRGSLQTPIFLRSYTSLQKGVHSSVSPSKDVCPISWLLFFPTSSALVLHLLSLTVLGISPFPSITCFSFLKNKLKLLSYHIFAWAWGTLRLARCLPGVTHRIIICKPIFSKSETARKYFVS